MKTLKPGVLPGLLRIRPSLTPLAAAGLVIVMVGATAFTVVAGGGISALIPATVGLLAAFVGYGRWRLVPLAAHRRGRFQLVEA